MAKGNGLLKKLFKPKQVEKKKEEYIDDCPMVGKSYIKCMQPLSNTRIIVVTQDFKRDYEHIQQIAEGQECYVVASVGKILLSGPAMFDVAREFSSRNQNAIFHLRTTTKSEAIEQIKEALTGTPPLNIYKTIYLDNFRLVEQYGKCLDKIKNEIKLGSIQAKQ